jgi:branched-chain amino acid transport system ATP-binding protein
VTALLELDGVRTGFGPTTVLHGVDLSVAAGEATALLGLNGAGKSVTLRTVAGLVPAWAGRIVLDGRDVTGLPAEERVPLGMAHVTQGRGLFPDRSVEENLRLGAYTLRRHRRGRYEPLLAETLERFPRLAERRAQRSGTLSGGERAMLAVARALMAEPRLMLVDEPSAGLAPRAADEVLKMLVDVRSTGVTILLVEQNVRFALDLADRVQVMRRGQIVLDVPAGQLDRAHLVAELGIGRLLARTPAPARPRPRRKRPLVADRTDRGRRDR